MIKPDWNNFKAKFSENPQNNFQWFCSLLFCKEFNKPTGISSYKNQSAIETDPIKIGDETIGWQAKFYSTTLSSNKVELINTIEKAKANYPDITKLIFYTNQEWVQNNNGQAPQAKIDVENKAKELNIKLELRTASFFESEFVSISCEIISGHFFSLDKSIIDLIKEQQTHSENILNEIQTQIIFNSQNIAIDRAIEIGKIEQSTEQVLIISGDGGVGKTAIIKKFYEERKKEIPIYILKATELELRNINDLFKSHNFQDFLKVHKDEPEKIFVVDSAEKLLDLRNTDPFKEFLTILTKENWKIIFTTRNSYLDDLNYQFFEIYKIIPLNISINNLSSEELSKISYQYSFLIPTDEKLLELIKNPFYLNEYLKFYKENEKINYTDFKEKLWNKNIKGSKPAREQCFLKIVLERVSDGYFFVIPNCESTILDELKKDGIIEYESPYGYFITHDIYEEWALEKIIDIEFQKKDSDLNFFKNIGSSLPMRRIFRKWVSEKLLLEDTVIQSFIENILKSKEIELFWKDEILVSVLLSEYSEKFFQIFKNELLKNDLNLLKKLTFLLRIACKEIDEDFFKALGVRNLNLFSLKYVLTKPKGQGWKSLIKFVFENLDTIGIQNIYFILPVIYDWNSKFKDGETTKFSSLIALRYYQWIIKEDIYFSRDNTKDHLLHTIVFGSSEIKNELEEIINEILKNKWKNHRDPYYELSKIILMKLEGVNISKILSKQVIQLANLFWLFTPKDSWHSDYRMGTEEYFGLENDQLDYFPASSYQTPIYWLLQSSLQETIDFILEFTNTTVESFAKSDFAKYEVEEVKVFIDNAEPIKQYISCRLWCMYRGNQSAPHVLSSIYMALEKFFLEKGKYIDSKTLESWLLYLLQNSKSVSISAVVASVVLAYPEKTFNVAKVLFRTKDFFFYDTSRLVLDQGQKGTLISLKAFGGNSKNEFYEEERLQACDDKHRKNSLENLFLNYQLIRSKETSEEESKNRQKILWVILDNYYKELPDPSTETGTDKTWRLYLARMDRRKMNLVTEKTKDNTLIHLNPQITPELKEYSEKSLEKSAEVSKYIPLQLWANYKLKNDENFKKYEKYENDPKIALKEVKEIVKKLSKIKPPQSFQETHTEDEKFHMFNHSIPGDVCSILIKDYFNDISTKDRFFCKNILLKKASFCFSDNYEYQISDGIQSTISVLPILLEKFPEEKEKIKVILLRILFIDYPIGMIGTSFNIFSIRAINKLWVDYFEDAQSILIGYLFLKPKLDELREKIRKENYKKNNYNLAEKNITKLFFKKNNRNLKKIIENKLSINDLGDVKKIDLYILKIAFQLIPIDTKKQSHKDLVKEIISAFVEKLISTDREDRVDYSVRHEFLERLAYFILSCPKEEVKEYMKPFMEKFKGTEVIANLFEQFISAEDYLSSYENFWEVWSLFEEKITELCKDGDKYGYISRIVKSYLFAQNQWKETSTEWHTLKDENKIFFKEILKKIGHCQSALYSISRLLNNIGSPYLDDGISWISDILKNNKGLSKLELETDTIYYLENVVRKYIYKNREKIKRTKDLKQDVLIILDFLIEEASVLGYILRESIL